MSACISREGEYGEHTPDAAHMCTRCYVLDEDALRNEVELLRIAESRERSLRTEALAVLDQVRARAEFWATLAEGDRYYARAILVILDGARP